MTLSCVMSRLVRPATGTRSARPANTPLISFKSRAVIRLLYRSPFGALIVRLLVALLALAAPVGAITALALSRFLRRTWLRALLRELHLHGGRLARLQREHLAAEAALAGLEGELALRRLRAPSRTVTTPLLAHRRRRGREPAAIRLGRASWLTCSQSSPTVSLESGDTVSMPRPQLAVALDAVLDVDHVVADAGRDALDRRADLIALVLLAAVVATVQRSRRRSSCGRCTRRCRSRRRRTARRSRRPPSSVSSPAPPFRPSPPSPPESLSLPSPPTSVSLPASPLRVSLPSPPNSMSEPPRPASVSFPPLPIRMFPHRRRQCCRCRRRR